ncbi:MAG: hypothetical protein FWE01_02205 [Firmicutes bacterium]|nr:hypothetical protein [Bacillota bacterium]
MEKKPKSNKMAKFLFAMFIILSVMSAFLFWATNNTMRASSNGEVAETTEATPSGNIGTLLLVAAIISLCLAIFFGVLCFLRWIRGKSVSGGLFLTTAISTAVFLGTSHFLGALLPPAIGAFGIDPAAEQAGSGIVFIIAQIGLFAMWFAFLLLTIWVYVRPIKRVDKYLGQILEGEQVKKVRVGKSKQYKEIEIKLKQIASKVSNDDDQKTTIAPPNLDLTEIHEQIDPILKN